MTRERVLHITIQKDCNVQTFRCGGKGGQNKDKRDTGVRVIHRMSGARGESREERSQLANKKLAFRRMAESPEFKTWLRQAHAEASIEIDRWKEETEKWLDEEMRPDNLLIEYS
jgi:protein subunit release factor B